MTLRLAPSPWRTDIFRRLNNRLENVVGAKTAKPFETLKIWTVGDLMRHLPRRYFSGTELSDLSTLQRRRGGDGAGRGGRRQGVLLPTTARPGSPGSRRPSPTVAATSR